MPDVYYEDNFVQLYCGDCREILPTLPPVDLIVTDPPYGVGYEGGHYHGKNWKQRKRDALIGDTVDVYAWALPLLFAASCGPCYIFSPPGAAAHNVYSAIAAARGSIMATIIWNKTNATYAAMRSQYKPRCEMIFYCKGPKARTLWTGPTTESTVWDFKRDPTNIYHPTQKPVGLMLRAIGNHAAPLVLDPFAGAGSTLIAAKDLRRRAIGIELEEKYCKAAARRLASFEPLPLPPAAPASTSPLELFPDA